MQERIIEIIIFLLEQFQQKPEKDSATDLSKELATRGYTDHEINLAFSWVTTHLQTRNMHSGSDYELNAPVDDVDLEKLIITPEAYGYLIQVYHLGMLKEYDIEDVIDRALSVGSNHITLDDVKKVTAAIIFNSEPGSNNLFFQSGSNSIH